MIADCTPLRQLAFCPELHVNQISLYSLHSNGFQIHWRQGSLLESSRVIVEIETLSCSADGFGDTSIFLRVCFCLILAGPHPKIGPRTNVRHDVAVLCVLYLKYCVLLRKHLLTLLQPCNMNADYTDSTCYEIGESI